ncbi:MAG: DNA methyltransferase [Ruthenibacterium lactatiformans]
MGSGTTAIACRNSNRDFVGFEIDKVHFETALERLKE